MTKWRPILNPKFRVQDHRTLTRIIAQCSPWHLEAIEMMGLGLWTKLRNELAHEDTKLIGKLLRTVEETDDHRYTVKIYNKKFEISPADVRRYFGLNDGTTPYHKKTLSVEVYEQHRDKFTSKIKPSDVTPMISGASCDAVMKELLEITERPDEDRVLEFQRTLLWLLLIDVLCPTVARFSPLGHLMVETLEDIRETDWATYAFDHMMELIKTWQKRVKEEIARQRVIRNATATGVDVDEALIAAGLKKRRAGQSKPMTAKFQKVADVGGSGVKKIPMPVVEEEEADEAEVENIDEEDENEQEDNGGKKKAEEKGEKKKQKSQQGRLFCGGAVLFFQVTSH